MKSKRLWEKYIESTGKKYGFKHIIKYRLIFKIINDALAKILKAPDVIAELNEIFVQNDCLYYGSRFIKNFREHFGSEFSLFSNILEKIVMHEAGHMYAKKQVKNQNKYILEWQADLNAVALFCENNNERIETLGSLVGTGIAIYYNDYTKNLNDKNLESFFHDFTLLLYPWLNPKFIPSVTEKAKEIYLLSK